MNDKIKNILIVHNYYQIPGGEDTVVHNEKQMLEENGHKVVLYTRNNNEIKTMSALGKMMIPIITVFNPRTYKEIKKIIRDEDIDVVHVHNTLNLVSPAAYYAAVKMHIPVVQTIHNFRLLCPKATFYRDESICEDCIAKGIKCALKHKCYRDSFVQTLGYVISQKLNELTGIYSKLSYICLTDFNKQKFLNFKSICEGQVHIKPNFTEAAKEIIPEEKRKNQFVYAGRLEKQKGTELLLKSWEILGDEAPTLILCGKGPLTEWCEEYIKRCNLNIEMRGFIPTEEVKSIIAESGALILPTRLYEGFPMTIVEAFSVGTPVICPNMGNCGNIVTEGVSGIKYSYDNLAEAVKRCNGMYESTFEVFKEQYTKDKNYQVLMKIYEESTRFSSDNSSV